LRKIIQEKGLLSMAKKLSFNYFEGFVKIADIACASAEIVDKVLNDFHFEGLSGYMDSLHSLEHSADEVNHGILTALIKEFIPPLEVEDITALSNKLDDVVDYIEDIIIKLYCYNIREIDPVLIEFSALILECCRKLRDAVGELEHFKKSRKLHEHIIAVNHIESRADELYISSLYNLHKQADDRKVIVWSRMLDSFEKVCDTCEDAANLMNDVVMKNA
jgi:uncharacterized protein Yka (UPF0111/DUF47 family)